jgi:signal transduction histidine kinase
MKEDGQQLTIYIADDGTGFNEAEIEKSVGILNIRHRTRLLGGTVEWQSSINNGTSVTIQLPIKS